MRTTLLFFTLILWAVCLFYVVGSINDEEEEPHPDPNEEDYSNMIYIGRMDDEGKRVGFEYDNGMYIVSWLPMLWMILSCKLDIHSSAHHLLFDIHMICVGIKYIFGTGFDETHKKFEETDLHHEHYGPDATHDVPDRAHGKTHEQILHEKRRSELDLSKGPKPIGWFGK